jgi:anti-sigma-K factor RskA
MNHPESDDIQRLASEYVLGTLSAQRRRQVEEELPRNPELQAAIRYWEERLLPLTALVEPAEPSAHLWPRIASNLGPAHSAASRLAPENGLARWWNNLNFWRGLSAAGFAAASVMAFMIGTAPQVQPAPQFMVVLAAPQNMAPGWIMQADNAQSLRLIPLHTTDVPQQKSLQLWTKGEGWTGPVSLGLVQPGQSVSVPLEKLPPLQANQLFEITLEPYKGSPIDRPTGPILYIGRTVKLS